MISVTSRVWITHFLLLALQGASYRAALHLDVCYQRADGGAVRRFNRRFGMLPIMVKSQVCYLENMNRRVSVPRDGMNSCTAWEVMHCVRAHGTRRLK